MLVSQKVEVFQLPTVLAFLMVLVIALLVVFVLLGETLNVMVLVIVKLRVLERMMVLVLARHQQQQVFQMLCIDYQLDQLQLLRNFVSRYSIQCP